MSDILQVFLLSMTPIGELRLAIPVGIAVYHINATSVFFVSVIGNLVPAIFLLFFLKKVSEYFSKKSRLFQKLYAWWENNARDKHSEKIQKYGAIGLALFVAVPLPLTGAWTGALLATIMELPIKKSLPAILGGVIGAGLIVTVLVVLGVNIEKYFGWQLLIGLMALAIIISIIRKKRI